MANKPPLPLFIVGATAVGKTSLALDLARNFRSFSSLPIALLSMDASQIYRRATIGTSKPSAAEQAEFLHGGLDLVDIGQPFTVANYQECAQTFLRSIPDHRLIIVGGTGLYFRALTRGLCLTPEPPAALRAELNALSVTELQQRLHQVDPEIAPRLDQQNPRRLIRAIEVMETSGRSLAQWQAETPPPLLPHFLALHLRRSRLELRDRIDQRVKAMLAAGWIHEVHDLLQLHGPALMHHFMAIGYRHIVEHCQSGCINLALPNDQIALIVQETQQYAKRQLTWFAREPSLTVVNVPDRLHIPLLELPQITPFLHF